MIKHNIILALAALAAMFSACSKESGGSGADSEEGREVKIEFKAGSRGATDKGSVRDRYINSMRVLIYDYHSGELEFNIAMYGLGGVPDTSNEELAGTLVVKTGKYTFIYIANEHSDPAANAMLSGITKSANNTLDYLIDNVKFSRAAFDSSKDIPMVKIKEQVIIQGDNRILDPELATAGNPTGLHTTVWPISLIRLGVRLDVSVYMTPEEKLLWKTESGMYRLYINNIPNEVGLLPTKSYSGGYLADDSYYLEMNSLDMIPVSAVNPHTWSRVILPESYFDPAGDATNALTIGFKDGMYNTRRTGYVGYAPPTDYTLPRNTYRAVSVKLDIRTLEPVIEIKPVIDWSDENIGGVEVF